MFFTLDASITACWLLPDERHPTAEVARRAMIDDGAIVPALWWFEVRNLLIMNERRGRIDRKRTDDSLRLLNGFPLATDHAPDEATVLSLARRHHLSVYDAAYLELVLRSRSALATLDAALATAARAQGVVLLGG